MKILYIVFTYKYIIIPNSSPEATTSSSIQSTTKRIISSQPIQIPEIPPFRRRDNQHSNYPLLPTASQSPQTTASSFSVTPPNISEIPPFKSRKSSDYSDVLLSQEHRDSQDSNSALLEHQLTIGPTGGAEWMRRLKVVEQSPIHRSTDCIVSKELVTSSDADLLKPAPSLTNVALKLDIAPEASKILKIYFLHH